MCMNQFGQNDSEQRSILLVDDDPVIRQILSLILQEANYLVHEAINGVQALSIYKSHAPNLVLTDVEMPEMDGITLTTKIRESNLSIPIIVMSAEELNLPQAEVVGANCTLLKPMDIHVALEMVESFLCV